MKQNFRKNEIVTGKRRSLFVLPILFVLTLASDRAVLYEIVAFSILLLSTKKRYSSFLKRVCVFQKTCFIVKALKSFQWSSHKYMPISQTKGYFKNPYYLFLEKHMLFLLALKWNLYEKAFFCFKTKTNSNFAVKPYWNAERRSHPFLFIWWITFFEHVHPSICDNGMYRI